jgi:hypothetical protein
MRKNLKKHMGKNELLNVAAMPLIANLVKGKGMKKGGKKSKPKRKGGKAINLVGPAGGGAVTLVGHRRGGSFLSSAAKLGAQFLKQKLTKKMNEKAAEYAANPNKAFEDASKVAKISRDIYRQIKAGSGYRKIKLKTLKTRKPRKLTMAGQASTEAQRTTGVVLTKKNTKEPVSMSISQFKKKV